MDYLQPPAPHNHATAALTETERAAAEILSLPMHPLLTTAQVEQVAAGLCAALA